MTRLAVRAYEARKKVIASMVSETKWKRDLALAFFFNAVRAFNEALDIEIKVEGIPNAYTFDVSNPVMQRVWDDFYQWEANGLGLEL